MSGRNGVVLGIDMGTTYCSASYYDVEKGKPVVIEFEEPESDHRGSRKVMKASFPSAVDFGSNDTVVGAKAFNGNNVFFDAKRLIGNSKRECDEFNKAFRTGHIKAIRENDRNVMVNGDIKKEPSQIYHHLLSRIKSRVNELGLVVGSVYVTVPAMFDHHQITETVKCCEEVFGSVTVKHVHEPSAAVCYCVRENNDIYADNFVVYDFGGGTFDMASLYVDNNTLELDTCEGNSRLGGRDIDEKLKNLIFKKQPALEKLPRTCIPRLNREIEKFKIDKVSREDLSGSDEVFFIFKPDDSQESIRVRLSFEEIRNALSPIYEKTDEVLKKILDDNSDNKIIAIGGTSNIRYFIDQLISNSKEGSCFNITEPELAVCKGAALYGAIKENLIKDIEIKARLNFSYGFQDDRGEMISFLKRGEPAPITRKITGFRPAYRDQNNLRIDIYCYHDEGGEKTRLGFLEHTIPKNPGDDYSIDVEFSILESAEMNLRVNISDGFEETVGEIVRQTNESLSDRMYDFIFICDATESMRFWVDGIKEQVEGIVKNIGVMNIDIRYGAVFYRDTIDGDGPTGVDKICMTEKDDYVYKLRNSGIRARSGGEDEDWVSAYEAMLDPSFGIRDDAIKIVYHAADAAAHGKDYGGRKYDDQVNVLDKLIERIADQGYHFHALYVDNSHSEPASKSFTRVREIYRKSKQKSLYTFEKYREGTQGFQLIASIFKTVRGVVLNRDA